jgi:diguanylate cyclase (GGDEF)-like protein
MASETEADANFVNKLITVLSENRGKIMLNENIEYLHQNGSRVRYFSVVSRPILWRDSKARAYMVSDVSAERLRIQELESQAKLDDMTGLYNRRFAIETLNKWVREHRTFVLCFVDINNLKHVNDSYGHHNGDLYIRSVADNLRNASPGTVVCRAGGDEFMLLFDGATEEEADVIMKGIEPRITDACIPADIDIKYSISYGLAGVAPDSAMEPSEIMQLADDRMYANKRRMKAIKKL